MPGYNAAPNYNSAPVSDSGEGKWPAITIVAFVMSFCFSLVGLILGIVASNKYKSDPTLKGKGMATAAIIISAVGMGMSLLYYVFLVPLILGDANDLINSLIMILM